MSQQDDDIEHGAGAAGQETPQSPTPGGGAAATAASAASDAISRLSIDSHHSHQSYVSHHSYRSGRSRWSTAATVATTIAPPVRHWGEAPQLLEEELSGSSGGSDGAAFGAGRGAAVTSRGGETGLASGPTATHQGSEAADKLPPRLIVFYPDGSFGIGVDKAREGELKAAAEAVAAVRRREQRAAAAAALNRAGDALPSGQRPPADLPEGSESQFAAWRAAFLRQKLTLVCGLMLDVVYLAVLLILRIVWGRNGTEPSLSSAAKFFIGSHPASTSLSFLAGSMFTDFIALYGCVADYPSIITLLIVWSIVLGVFAILEMPIAFVLLRLLLLIAAFQLRFTMARLRNMLPPWSLGALGNPIQDAGRQVAAASRATWGALSAPFLSRGQQQQLLPPSLSLAAGRGQRQPGAASPPSSPGPASAQLAAARSSALFRAAVLRMLSEQQQHQRERGPELEQDVEAGGSSATQQQRSSGTFTAGTQRRSLGGSAPASSRLPLSSATGSTAGLYARIMQDIAAVSATPSSSDRRRRRRRERDSRRQQMLASVSATSSGSPRRQPSAAAGGSEAGSSSDEGSEADDPAQQGAAGRPPSSGGTGSSRALPQPEPAVGRAAAVAERQVGSQAGGQAGATWDDLVALLAHHSQQQLLRRQRQQEVDVVPLVMLEAPAPQQAADQAPLPAQQAADQPLAMLDAGGSSGRQE